MDRHKASILVGRNQEQARLREELAAAIAGHGRLVIVDGEAGIGKTTLARDLVQEATSRQVGILSGHCYDRMNAPPYGPWLELFESYEMEPSRPAPPAAFAEGRLTRVSSQAGLFNDVRRFLAELAAQGPVLVLLEDLHWADPSSLDLLRYLGVYLGQWPVLLVGTYRPDELPRNHPFYQHLPALVREAGGLCLHLRRLDTDAFQALVGARYRLPASDMLRLVAYLDRHADGNPFFAVELLQALEEEGLLRSGDDRSSLGDLARVVVPTLLRQVIDSRIARLGEDTRQPLEIAAVIGQEVSLALWATMTGLDIEAMLSIVERAVGVHLMEAEREGTRVRFVHALTREALYEGILPPRRRQWHGRVGEALATEADTDPEAVAVHFQQSGDDRAWEWLVRAGDRAQAAYAWLTAAERLRSAATLLEGRDGHEHTYSQLVFRVAQLLRFSDPHVGITALDEVERLARQRGDTVLMAEARWMRGHLLCYLDRFQPGLAEILESLEIIEAAPLETARISATIRLWFPDITTATASLDLTEDDLLVKRLNAEGLDFRRCVYAWHLAAVGQAYEAAAIGEHLLSLLADVPATGGGVH
ncbi:MAG: AAA family ATPase, partial [Thermomicrobiales bacterium]